MVCTQLNTSMIGINWYCYQLPIGGSFHGCPKNVSLLALLIHTVHGPSRGWGGPLLRFKHLPYLLQKCSYGPIIGNLRWLKVGEE